MSPKANNPEPGHACDAYPLTALTRPQPSMLALQAFQAVAQLGSLNKAANHLCRTQGAVSRQIQQLEQHYQTALFVRTVTGMRLTMEGEALLQVSTHVLSRQADYAQERMTAPDTLRLRLPSTLALRWFLPRLEAIERQLPGLSLQISTSVSDEPAFADGATDAMIVRGNGDWAGLHALRLFPEQLTPMCRPDRAIGLRSPQDVSQLCLLHASHERQEWRAWLAMAGVEQPVAQGLAFDSLEVALSAATLGHGIAMGDPRMAQSKLVAGELVCPFPHLSHSTMAYYLVVPEQSREQTAIQRLGAALCELA